MFMFCLVVVLTVYDCMCHSCHQILFNIIIIIIIIMSIYNNYCNYNYDNVLTSVHT